MAQRKTVVRYCDSCLKDTPATATVPFGYGGTDYKIDVCDKHADALQRDLMSWARLATEVEKAPSQFMRPDQVRDYTRTPIRAVTEPKTASPSPVKDSGSTPAPAKAAPKPAVEISHPALEWTLSDHAEDQLAERGPKFGFTRADVFLCVTAPERVVKADTTAKAGREQWFRGNVQLIVDPQTKVVITVLPKSTLDFEDPKSRPSTTPFSHREEFARATA